MKKKKLLIILFHFTWLALQPLEMCSIMRLLPADGSTKRTTLHLSSVHDQATSAEQGEHQNNLFIVHCSGA